MNNKMLKKIFRVENNWTDYGWFIGISIGMGFSFHWSHFITAGILIIFSYFILKPKEDKKLK